MRHEDKGVIRLGDTTDHGGEVISASGSTIMGEAAALVEDKVKCPKCGGVFTILPNNSQNMCMGRAFTYQGDLTDCGAKLISSL